MSDNGRTLSSCPVAGHFGFPRGACALCSGTVGNGAPVSTLARSRSATTTALSRARRLARDAEIAQQRDDDRLRANVYRHTSNPLARTPLRGGGHDWTAQGRYEDGDARFRCTRCHAHDRMPLATQLCVRMPR